jgi:hypothetical protein
MTDTPSKPLISRGLMRTAVHEPSATNVGVVKLNWGLGVPTKAPASDEPSFVTLSLGDLSLEVALVEVTPAMAERFLMRMVRNRAPIKRNVEFLSGELHKGWSLNGEPLIFDEDDMMIDGQHRCLSCVNTGIPFTTLVVRKVARVLFDRIDTGSKRAPAHTLHAEGIANASHIASVIPRLLQWQRSGNWWDKTSDSSNHDVKAGYFRFEGLASCVSVGAQMTVKLHGTKSFWSTAYYIARALNAADADSFFAAVIDGAGLNRDDPRFVLRQKLLELSKEAHRVRLNDKTLAILFSVCWNAYRRRRPIKLINAHKHEAPLPLI